AAGRSPLQPTVRALWRVAVPRWSLRPPTGTLGVSVAPSSVVCGASYVDYEVSLSESDWRRFDGKPYVGDGTDFRSGNPHNCTLAPVLPPKICGLNSV